MNKPLSHHVLVYGTLRNGGHNHHFLANAEPIRELHLPYFTMVSLGSYPAVHPSNNPAGVLCELYKIDEATFANLDMLEGYPDLYDRMLVKILLCPKQKLTHTWIYYMPEEQLADKPVILSGDWLKHLNQPSSY